LSEKLEIFLYHFFIKEVLKIYGKLVWLKCGEQIYSYTICAHIVVFFLTKYNTKI